MEADEGGGAVDVVEEQEGDDGRSSNCLVRRVFNFKLDSLASLNGTPKLCLLGIAHVVESAHDLTSYNNKNAWRKKHWCCKCNHRCFRHFGGRPHEKETQSRNGR